MNSRDKGKRGELEFAALLREHGFEAKRGQQFAGGAESPDVKCEALSWLHFEVKRVQNLNLTDACVQAEGDCGGKPWVVAHRRNHAPWLITMRAELFFELLREFEPRNTRSTRKTTTEPDGGGLRAGMLVNPQAGMPALRGTSRQVATGESGDKSPHSKGDAEIAAEGNDLGRTPDMSPRDAGATNNRTETAKEQNV